MQKKWMLKEADENAVRSLQQALRIHPALCRVLSLRGINAFDEAHLFFRTSSEHLHDPFLMKGMSDAVARIHRAITNKEKMLIYGDYDVDGTTAVALAYNFLRKIHPSLSYYIPHRFKEGYGVSSKGIDYAIEQGVDLIITLDCGIKSVQHIQRAKEHGIDTIVCDHHLPDTILPDALAILNPKQPGCTYPYKELCGCGIAYKLIAAYSMKYDSGNEYVNENLDLVATAIAADIVPITGENRTLCVLGLEKANSNPSIALRALRVMNDLKKPFTINDLVFIIAPRVNAAGRMDDARKAVELFLAEDIELAKEIATKLHADNDDRRVFDKTTTEEALLLLEGNEQHARLHSTIVYDPEWHKGVVGIVASRLIDHHYRPTIVLTKSEGKVTGSARSIKGFNMFEGLNQCAEYLENWGGHYFAAGLTLKEENLPDFSRRFNEVVAQTVPIEFFQPLIEIDAVLDLKDITPSFLRILKQFNPHGPENMKPVFRCNKVKDYNGSASIVKEKHLRLQLHQDEGNSINAIGFNLAQKMEIVKHKSSVDILFYIEENEWNGNTSIQLQIIDLA